MKKNISVAVCAFCLLLITPIAGADDSGAVPASGAEPGRGMGRGMGRNMPVFAEFDLDSNGYLHEDEFIEARTRRIETRAKEGRMMRGLSNMLQFQDLDQDSDGKVTQEEFERGVMAHMRQRTQ
jgi:hypothetical protein